MVYKLGQRYTNKHQVVYEIIRMDEYHFDLEVVKTDNVIGKLGDIKKAISYKDMNGLIKNNDVWRCKKQLRNEKLIQLGI